jgi:hypothetical protein
MKGEASNIMRRFIRIVVQLDPSELGYLGKAARTLDPRDLRLLAREIEGQPRDRTPVKIVGSQPPKPVHGPDREQRGIARSNIEYGGPAAVRRDADPELVEAVDRIGWSS